MKLKLKQLREAVQNVLAESEIFVDEQGYAHDDEGNTWYVGKGGVGGTYKASDFGRRYGGVGPTGYASQPKPPRGAPDGLQFTAIRALAARMPTNNFVTSIKTQMERGGNLSPKQKTVVVQIMMKVGMTAEAALFV